MIVECIFLNHISNTMCETFSHTSQFCNSLYTKCPSFHFNSTLTYLPGIRISCLCVIRIRFNISGFIVIHIFAITAYIKIGGSSMTPQWWKPCTEAVWMTLFAIFGRALSLTRSIGEWMQLSASLDVCGDQDHSEPQRPQCILKRIIMTPKKHSH